MKRLSKNILKFFLTIAAVTFGFIILLQVGLLCALAWLNSNSGQVFIKDQLGKVTADSGYRVEYGSISYELNGIKINRIEISDAGGIISDIDHASLYLSLSSLPLHKISISVLAGEVTIYRLPESQPKAEQDKEVLKPFDLPDIYFKTWALQDFSIEKLHLKEEVAGKELLLSPKFQAEVQLKNTIQYNLQLQISQIGENVSWLPENILSSGVFSPETLKLSLEKLEIKSASYNSNAQGFAVFAPEGNIDISVTADSRDIFTLTGYAGVFESDLSLSGKTSNPDIALRGNISAQELTAKGLGDIFFKGNVANFSSGNLIIETTYRDQPLSFKADIDYDTSNLMLSNINLTGKDAALMGDLAMPMQSKIVTGNLQAKVNRLETYSELVGYDFSGEMLGTLSLSKSIQDTQAAKLELKLDKVRYEAYKIGKAGIDADFSNVFNIWPDALNVLVQGVSITDAIQIKSFAAKLKRNGDNGYVAAVDANGNIPQAFEAAGKANIYGLDKNAPEVNDLNLRIKSLNSSVSLSGKINQEMADLKLTADKFLLKALPIELPENMPEAALTGSVVLSGPLDDPKLVGDVSSGITLVSKGAPSINLQLHVLYEAKKLTANLKGNGQGIEKLSGDIGLPLTFSLKPFVFEMPKDGFLKGGALFDLNGAALANMFLPADHQFSGQLHGDVDIAGTIGTPQISGVTNLRKGKYSYLPYDVTMHDMAFDLGLKGSELTLSNFSANDGEQGKIHAAGKLDVENKKSASLKIGITNYHLLKSHQANGRIDADIQVSGKNDGYTIGGDVSAQKLEIVIPEQFRSNIPQLNIVEKESSKSEILESVTLSINVHAPKEVFVRGWGLDAEFGGDLNVVGTLDAPLINGNLASIRGRYEEFNKRFDLKKANMRFQGAVPPSPYLDIEATTKVGDINASVLLTGPVNKPAISFASTPSLPQDEVLAHLLFGKTMNKITPFQAIQLAQTLQRFSGNGGSGFDPLGKIRSLTGIDDISVNTDEAGESSVGVGKYLSDGVYLEVEKGKAENSGAANLQIEVTPSVSVESKIGQDAQGGAGIFWSHDY